jgi:hypothetical protein
MVKVHSHTQSIEISIGDRTEKLSLPECEALIRELGIARGRCQPQVPSDPPNTNLRIVNDPRYWVNKDGEAGGGFLRLRHSELGWLTFRLPPKEAEGLSELLAKWATDRAQNPPTAPKRLYKYMKAEHLESALSVGRFRVGTLHEFRQIEKFGKEIGDAGEGKKTTFQTTSESVTFDLLSDDTRAQHARRVFTGWDKFHPASRLFVTLEPKAALELYEQCPDLFIYSSTIEFNADQMRAFGYDACLEIHNPHGFFAELTKTMGLPEAFGAEVQYGDLRVDHEAQGVAPAGFLKDRSYASQQEFRVTWEPLGLPIRPCIVPCPAALEYCRRYTG